MGRTRMTRWLLAVALLAVAGLGVRAARPAQGQSAPSEETVFLPIVRSPAQGPDDDREWDPRLDQRGALLIEATVTPGQGYWRLIRARWYDEAESAGRHHIFMDALDENGSRDVGVPVFVTWSDGSTTVTTEAKPGEEYATNFAMFSLAPAYAARPYDGAPADVVDGMGMGTIEDPTHAVHTSYGLVWRWTIAGETPQPTSSPSPTVTGTVTVTPTATTTVTATPTVTATVTPTGTPTFTPTPTSTPTSTPDPGYAFSRAVVESCAPNDGGARIEGVVYQNDQPADGYRVVFSWQPDGGWSTEPAVSGPNPPGAYTHIISSGVAIAGDWWVWIVDGEGARISPMASFHSDGPGGECNVATINFYGP